jgi:hypothetical protein
MKKVLFILGLLVLNNTILANTPSAISDPSPHFYVEMQNQSQKNASISFAPGVGNVFLQPELLKMTPLPANQTSNKYGVYFDPLVPEDTFNIIFTGKNDCIFTVGFFAPADPIITMSGLGCAGGGYKIIENGTTLLLYISDIHK